MGTNACAIWRQSMLTEQSIAALAGSASPRFDSFASAQVADMLRFSGLTAAWVRP